MLNHKRIFWLDTAKAYGIILVFYGHIIERFEILGSSSMAYQHQIIYGFHIPLFFIVSGYFSKNFSLNLKQRLSTRIVPFIFFNFCISLPLQIYSDLTNRVIRLPLYASGIVSILKASPVFNFMTWFLVCLFTVEIIDYLVNKYVISNIKTTNLNLNWWFMLAATMSYVIGITVISNQEFFISNTGIGLNFWFLHEAFVAYLFYKFGRVLNNIGIIEKCNSLFSNLFMIIAFSTIFWATISLNSRVNMALSQHGNPIIFPITAISGSLFAIFLARLTPQNSLILWVGRNTLILIGTAGIFHHLINESYTRLIYPYIQHTDLVISLVSALGTIGSILFSVPIVYVLNKLLPQLVGKPKISESFLPQLRD